LQVATRASAPAKPELSSARRSGSGIMSLAPLSLQARRMLDTTSTECASATTPRSTPSRAALSSCRPGASSSRMPPVHSALGAQTANGPRRDTRRTSGHSAPSCASSAESMYGRLRRPSSAALSARSSRL
jgi:hypothetical protein